MEKIHLIPEMNTTDDVEKNDAVTKLEAEKVEKVFLGTTKDGAKVYREPGSHFHPEGGLTFDILRSALGVIDTEERSFVREQVRFNQPIGKKTCVEIGPEDDIVMIYRKGRSGQTPMVKNREAEPCDLLTVIIGKDGSGDNDSYKLVTSFIGGGSEREPWDPNIESDEEKQKCKDFWDSHALVYDDNLIDWERTKAFEFMSEPAKRVELIRQRVVFAGVFVEPDELYHKIQPTLEKTVKNPHVTTSFKPNISQLNLEQIGSGAKIYAIGYGNDGKNEGLLVKVEAEEPAIQQACDGLETPHITLSTSKHGRAVDTANLEFSPLEKPFELTGTYGLFSQGKVVENSADLEL